MNHYGKPVQKFLPFWATERGDQNPSADLWPNDGIMNIFSNHDRTGGISFTIS